MKNHLTGFIISALIHSGLVSGAIYLNKKEIEDKTPEEKVTLMVSLFQEEIQPVVKTPVQEDLSSTLIPSVSAIVKREKAPEAKKITPPKPVVEEIIPAIKVTSISPKLESQVEAKPIEKPLKKPEVVKPKIQKFKPLKKLEKKAKKKKVKIKKKVIVKKTIKRGVQKKKVARKKVFKKKVVVKKRAKPVKRKVVVRKKSQPKPRKVIAKTLKRVKVQPRHAISTLVKRAVRHPVAKQAPRRNVQAKRPSRTTKPSQRTKTAQYQKAGSAVHKKIVTNTATKTNLNSQYKLRLQRIISVYSKKHYPKRAKRRGQQGKVTVAFTVIHSGMIKNIRIIKGSNNRALDAAAIQAIKNTSRKLPYFKGMSKSTLNLSITLAYILR